MDFQLARNELGEKAALGEDIVISSTKGGKDILKASKNIS